MREQPSNAVANFLMGTSLHLQVGDSFLLSDRQQIDTLEPMSRQFLIPRPTFGMRPDRTTWSLPSDTTMSPLLPSPSVPRPMRTRARPCWTRAWPLRLWPPSAVPWHCSPTTASHYCIWVGPGSQRSWPLSDSAHAAALRHGRHGAACRGSAGGGGTGLHPHPRRPRVRRLDDASTACRPPLFP